MPAASPSTLTLAAQLRASDDQSLRELLTLRRVDASGIRDFFDLADALLTPDSVRAALATLDRTVLWALATIGTQERITVAQLREQSPSEAVVDHAIERAIGLALLERHGDRLSVPDAVRTALGDLAARGLTVESLHAEHPPIPLTPVREEERASAERLATERAAGVVVELTEFVWELSRHPARPLARGGIALPDAKRLAEAAAVPIERVETLRRLAESGGLIEHSPAGWVPTDYASHWLTRSGPERWAALAGRWLETFTPEVRGALRSRAGQGWRINTIDHLKWLYPAADKHVRARLARDAELADALGFSGDGLLIRPAAALALEGEDAAARALADVFPPAIDRVYVQHDLTVIAPGPLRADLDAELRGIADVTAPGIAATYRISRESLTRAISAGASADDIRQTLERVSLTGVPQPLAYLIDETAARYGAVRVGEAVDDHDRHRSALTYVRSDDEALIAAIEVDQSLAALRLQRTGAHRLLSRVAPSAVYWALSDARYPVAFEHGDELGAPPARPERRRGANVDAAASDPIGELIEGLRTSDARSPHATEQAWLARQLEFAIRAKAEVSVTVRMPHGDEIEYALQPTGLAGGRLRARDRTADVERTLPLSHITAVTERP